MAVPTVYGKQKTTRLECISKRAIHRKDTIFNNIGYVAEMDGDQENGAGKSEDELAHEPARRLNSFSWNNSQRWSPD